MSPSPVSHQFIIALSSLQPLSYNQYYPNHHYHCHKHQYQQFHQPRLLEGEGGIWQMIWVDSRCDIGL